MLSDAYKTLEKKCSKNNKKMKSSEKKMIMKKKRKNGVKKWKKEKTKKRVKKLRKGKKKLGVKIQKVFLSFLCIKVTNDVLICIQSFCIPLLEDFPSPICQERGFTETWFSK